MYDHNHDAHDSFASGHSHSDGHGHAGHHHGGEPNDLAQALGLSDHGGHNFLGHILGTDSCGQVHHHPPTMAPAGSTNPGMVNSPGAFYALDWKHAFSGIGMSRNLFFALIFVCMMAWLCVVWWIRHNEPAFNRALGVGGGAAPAQTITANSADLRLLAGTRNAMPIPTQQTGVNPELNFYAQPQAVPAPHLVAAPAMATNSPMAQSVIPGTYSYHTPIREGYGVRVRTIVNR